MNADSRRFKHIDGQIDIGGGFKLACDAQNTVPRQKGKREKQPGEILRTDITGQAIFSCHQLSTEGEGERISGWRFDRYSMGSERLNQFSHGALRETAMAGESGGYPQCSRHGYKKPQCGATFSTVGGYCRVWILGGNPPDIIVHASVCAVRRTDCCAEGGKNLNGGVDIIAWIHAAYNALSVGECRRNQQAVRDALGGGDTNLPI